MDGLGNGGGIQAYGVRRELGLKTVSRDNWPTPTLSEAGSCQCIQFVALLRLFCCHA